MARPYPKNPKGEQKSPKKTKETIGKLLDGFKSDFTISEACSYAWIHVSTYHERIDKDKQLSKEIDSAKEYCFLLAKNAVRKWLNEGDKEYSLKRLKNRQNKLYSERNAESENNINITINDIKSMSDEDLAKSIDL